MQLRALVVTCLFAFAVALSAALLASPGAPAAPTLFVGDGKDYSAAFKSEEGQLYVLELAGRTDCYYTEPHEDVSSGAFSAFPAPKLMTEGPKGSIAEESTSSLFGGASARVRASLEGDHVTGGFSFDESEESFHCDTGFSEVPLQADRYEPIGSQGSTAPKHAEVRAYYGVEGPTEVFLRISGGVVGGIRGAFTPSCPVGRRGSADPHSLFSRPTFAKGKPNGYFRQEDVTSGRTRSGTRFQESITIKGRVGGDAVTGTYLRVRTVKSADGPQRCATGPLPFRAVRYVPAVGA